MIVSLSLQLSTAVMDSFTVSTPLVGVLSPLQLKIRAKTGGKPENLIVLTHYPTGVC